MSKCEWKDGKFVPCKMYSVNYEMRSTGVSRGFVDGGFHEFVYCPYCSGTLGKPKEPNKNEAIDAYIGDIESYKFAPEYHFRKMSDALVYLLEAHKE